MRSLLFIYFYYTRCVGVSTPTIFNYFNRVFIGDFSFRGVLRA